ncbi:ASCH domain-containing protein [Photobacterium atrarenae]|uniref:ASCH domain-containing protein n=1 Tax=Photobacterium atrarenae TaxID=865757 RepID=A0ABY5GN45_9GAMM|nr:ASCH domain-containing protein [Photobacterium atrarenae]UTV30525.1 ASCH domain-containing protein [Photobacterium atrarenae]
MEAKAQQYLDTYLNTLSEADRQRHPSFSADYFCADEINANLCAELVASGEKTATCSMKYWYEDGGETMPQVGHLQVVTDWHGNPKAIIEITSVSECRFEDVNEDFARAEGEGDLSLVWWRKAHWDFFSVECDEVGIEPSEQMVLVLERFQVVYS